MNYTTLAVLAIAVTFVAAQRISTIQLDGTQYFVSKQNPYAPALNFFLAYQYCRSLGLQLASFETKEKADAITMYLKNANYNKHEFWTSGNKLGTNMMLWMSTGLPFNATFDYMKRDTDSSEDPALNSARNLDVSALGKSCVAMTGEDLEWNLHDCGEIKDFICEQTRCYYYNYGSIPVSAAQGMMSPINKPSSPTAAASSSTASFFPTTPYPGLLENSVAPEEEVVAENLQAAPADTPLEEEQQQEVEESTGADLSGVVQDEEVQQSEEVEQQVGVSEEIMNPTTSPHHQPKRLEDLFPLERTRPIMWPRN